MHWTVHTHYTETPLPCHLLHVASLGRFRHFSLPSTSSRTKDCKKAAWSKTPKRAAWVRVKTTDKSNITDFLSTLQFTVPDCLHGHGEVFSHFGIGRLGKGKNQIQLKYDLTNRLCFDQLSYLSVVNFPVQVHLILQLSDHRQKCIRLLQLYW